MYVECSAARAGPSTSQLGDLHGRGNLRSETLSLGGMIASRVPDQWWLLVLLISVVARSAWHAWPAAGGGLADVGPDVRPVAYRYVPLLGIPLDDVVHEASGDSYEGDRDLPLEEPAGPVKTCLPFLAPILEYPRWQLRITSGTSSCFGDVIFESFAIASTGEVTWTRPGWPVRHLVLSSEQLALVRRLDRLSCVDLRPREGESGWVSIGLDLGKHHEDGGARISPSSTLGRAVTAMFDELMEQYRRPRRERVGAMDLRLATTEPGPVYRARVSGGRLTVRRGRKLLVDDPVDPDTMIDLFDAALEPREVYMPVAKGALQLHGRSAPVTIERYERGPFEPITNAIGKAQVIEAEARAGE